MAARSPQRELREVNTLSPRRNKNARDSDRPRRVVRRDHGGATKGPRRAKPGDDPQEGGDEKGEGEGQ